VHKSFKEAGAKILHEEPELSPSIIELLTSPEAAGLKHVTISRIKLNPNQPRQIFDQEALNELASSIKEHGVLQPVLLRPLGNREFELVAGERRLKAAQIAGHDTIPAIVEKMDDLTALEISLIENLQREDLNPLEEAQIYNRMTQELGYSIRSLAGKLGKDKGYVENRLRLASAPEDIQAMVSLRKDTLSHAYELLKIDDEKRRKRYEKKILAGELSVAKLRDRAEKLAQPLADEAVEEDTETMQPQVEVSEVPASPPPPATDLRSASLKLSESLAELGSLLGEDSNLVKNMTDIDRDNLRKYLSIARARLENIIARLR